MPETVTIEKQKLIDLLMLVASTLQDDYEDRKDCEKSIRQCLLKTDELAKEITGKSIVRYKSVLEHLVFPDHKPQRLL